MQGKEHRFKIGRSRQCDIVLDHDSISRVHAELTILPDGKLFLTDCNSMNGTAIIHGGQARPIHQDFISPTDVVRIGEKEISIKELLEFIKSPFIKFDQDSLSAPSPEQERPPPPKKSWPQGPRMVRCGTCGAVIETNTIC